MNLFESTPPKRQASIIETTWSFNEPPITDIDFPSITPENFTRISNEFKKENKIFQKYSDVDYIIAAENEEGPVEYKWSLHKVTTEDRIAHLSTQMRWRLSEGNGHAFYRLGVHDDGQCQGLTPKELNKTLGVFSKICKLANAEKVKPYKLRLPNGKFVVDIHIRKITLARASEMKLIMIGPEGAGKSTLIGCLSEGEADDGHGMSASFMLRHKHEFNSGRTSTADNFAFIGFDKESNVLNNSNCADTEELYKRAKYLMTLIDVAGIAKYRQTLLHGISFTNPDAALIVIQASRKDEFLKEYVELLNRCHIKIMAVVLTHCNEQIASENDNKHIYSDVKRSKSEPNFVPLIYVDCKNGFGMEQVQKVMLSEMEIRQELSVESTPRHLSPVRAITSTSDSKASSSENSRSATLTSSPKISKSCSKSSSSSKKSSLSIFKILETYQVYSTNGTIVTGRVKSGEIKENDILMLSPVEIDGPEPVESPEGSESLSPETKRNKSFSVNNLDKVGKSNKPRTSSSASKLSSPNEKSSLSTSMTISSSFCLTESPTIISAKKRKRKHCQENGSSNGAPKKRLNHRGRSRSTSLNQNGNGSSGENLDQNPEEIPVLNQVKVKILSIEKNRVRIQSAISGELVSLKVIVVEHFSSDPIIVKRGAMICNDPISNFENGKEIGKEQEFLPTSSISKSDFDFTNKVTLKLLNNSFKIDIKNRTRLEIFYDTAKLIGNVTTEGWTDYIDNNQNKLLVEKSTDTLNQKINWTKKGLVSNGLLHDNDVNNQDEQIVQVELESFELIKYGDTCLISCLRNLTDVTRCEFIRCD